MKRNSRFNLLFRQTKACQSLDTSEKKVQIFKDRVMTLATQQHLEGHYPAEDIIPSILGNIGIVLKFQPFVHTA